MASTTTTMSINKSSLAGPSRSLNATIPSMINAIRIREGSEAIDFSLSKKPRLDSTNAKTPKFKAPPTIKSRRKSTKPKKTRKALTLTYKATEEFLPVSLLDEEFIDEGLLAYVVPQEPEVQDDGPSTFFSSMARTQGRATKSKSKSKKRAASTVTRMAEPEEAIAAILNQQPVFGTSSQLVAPVPQTSSQESMDSDFVTSVRRNPRRTAPSLLDRFKATRSLWSEASRQEDGSVMEAEPPPTRDVSPVKTIELDVADESHTGGPAKQTVGTESTRFDVDILDTPMLPRSLVDAALSIRKTPGAKKSRSTSPVKRKTPATREKPKRNRKKASDAPTVNAPIVQTANVDNDDSSLLGKFKESEPAKKKRGRPAKVLQAVDLLPDVLGLDTPLEQGEVTFEHGETIVDDTVGFVDLEDIPLQQLRTVPEKKKPGRPCKAVEVVEITTDPVVAQDPPVQQETIPDIVNARPNDPLGLHSIQPDNSLPVVPEKKKRGRKPKTKAIVETSPAPRDTFEREIMPDYNKQTVPELSKLIKANGFKAVKGKAAMVALLEQCWRSTHPFESVEEPVPETSTARFDHFTFAPQVEERIDDNISLKSLSSSPSSARRPSTASSIANSTSTSASEISAGPTLLQKPTSKVKIREVPLETDDTGPYYRAITRAVKDQPDDFTVKNMTWWTRMLLYDPMPIEDLTDWLNAEGLLYVKPEIDENGNERKITEVWYGLVKGWCESKGVICVWKDGSRPNRKIRTKKVKKKSKPTATKGKGKARAKTPVLECEAVEE